MRGTFGERLAAGALGVLVLTGTVAGTGATALAQEAGIDPVEQYVTQVYNDLFFRDPDPEGLRTWATRLKSGTPYGEVSNGITYSREFRSGMITDSYDYYLSREPDPQGLENWLTAMADGLHIEQMQAGFVASAEFYEQAPPAGPGWQWYAEGDTDANWVAAAYEAILGREAGPTEVHFWLNELDHRGYHAVALLLLHSTEHLDGVVDGYYRQLLRRGIDPAGLHTWITAIQRGARDEEVIASIVSSAEYRSNVGSWPETEPVEPTEPTWDVATVSWQPADDHSKANGEFEAVGTGFPPGTTLWIINGVAGDGGGEGWWYPLEVDESGVVGSRFGAACNTPLRLYADSQLTDLLFTTSTVCDASTETGAS